MGSTARRLDVGPWQSLPKGHAPPLRRLASTPPRTATRLPELSREGLRWRTNGANVEIVVEVTNGGLEPTSPGVLVIEAAPLGAFVPGYEIARVPVLALDPGGRRRVPVTVARSLLPTTRGPGGTDQTFDMSMWELELVTSSEWAGNLNVWFDVAPERAVEAHRALDLKVAAGRRAWMWVFLPSDEAGFDFVITGMGAGWTAEIASLLSSPALVVGAPAAGNRTAITLIVTRRSDGRAVPVEFSFESVEGPGEHLGCIPV